jgi:hypothetical protein
MSKPEGEGDVSQVSPLNIIITINFLIISLTFNVKPGTVW